MTKKRASVLDARASDPSGGPLSKPAEFVIDSRRVLRVLLTTCIVAEVAFVVLDYHVNYGRMTDIGAIRRLFNSAREDSLASWFAVTQTSMIALTLWLLVALKRRTAPGWRAAGWVVVALFFTYMAIDDGAQVHERLGTAFKDAHQNGADAGDGGSWGSALLGFFPSYTWQLVFLPVFGALGAFTVALLWRELDDRSSRALVLLAMSCLVVAVAMDFVEGLEPTHPWNLYTRINERFQLDGFTMARFGKRAFRTLRHFSKSVEESFEMLGNSLLWYVILGHAMRAAGDVRLRFREAAPAEKRLPR